MIKLLVVDDERWVRKSIIGKINWEKFDIELAGEASNGIEALEQMEALSPDVIITDMRMPKMDGVELINTLRCNYPGVKIVVISGYTDFEYTKQALKNKVEDYILKPVEDKALNECITKIVKEIYLRKKKKNELQSLRLQAQIGKKSLIEAFLNRIVFDRFITQASFDKGCNDSNLKLDFTYYAVSVFSIINLQKAVNEKYAGNLEQFDLYLFNHLKVLLHDRNAICFRNTKKGYEYICIMGFYQESLYSMLCNTSSLILNSIESEFEITCVAGISNRYEGWTNIPLAYSEAVKACRCIDHKKNRRIIHINELDIGQQYSLPLQLCREQKSVLLSSIKAGKSEEIKKIVNELFESMNISHLINLDYLKLSCMELLISIEKELNNLKLTLKEIHSEDILSSHGIPEFNSIESARNWLINTLLKISDYCLVHIDINSKSVAAQARQYIILNYYEKISLKKMSDMFHINKIYFSKIYKNETGQNFINFLTKIRMEKAMEYIKNSTITITEIAELVGYDDQRHFSKLFKKYYNCSPSEARKLEASRNEQP